MRTKKNAASGATAPVRTGDVIPAKTGDVAPVKTGGMVPAKTGGAVPVRTGDVKSPREPKSFTGLLSITRADAVRNGSTWVPPLVFLLAKDNGYEPEDLLDWVTFPDGRAVIIGPDGRKFRGLYER